jgi:hypothetical protein
MLAFSIEAAIRGAGPDEGRRDTKAGDAENAEGPALDLAARRRQSRTTLCPVSSKRFRQRMLRHATRSSTRTM